MRTGTSEPERCAGGGGASGVLGGGGREGGGDLYSLEQIPEFFRKKPSLRDTRRITQEEGRQVECVPAASRTCSRVKELEKKRILSPKLKSASLWLEHVLLGGTWLEGSLWNHGAGEGVRKVPRTTYNTQVPPQFKNNC